MLGHILKHIRLAKYDRGKRERGENLRPEIGKWLKCLVESHF